MRDHTKPMLAINVFTWNRGIPGMDDYRAERFQVTFPGTGVADEGFMAAGYMMRGLGPMYDGDEVEIEIEHYGERILMIPEPSFRMTKDHEVLVALEKAFDKLLTEKWLFHKDQVAEWDREEEAAMVAAETAAGQETN